MAATTEVTSSDNTTADSADPWDTYLIAAEKWLKLISIPILLILGTTGNGLVILVLSVRKLKPHPTSLMLVVLAFFDTMVLWLGHFRMLYVATSSKDFRSNSNWLCKFHTYLTYSSISLSVWTLVMVTSHRLIAVYFPLRAKTLLTMRPTIISLSIMTFICAMFNIHLYWTAGLIDKITDATNLNSTSENVTTTICDHLPAADGFMSHIWPKMDLVTNSIVPFILLLLCNSTIIYKVRVGNSLLTKDVKDYKLSTNKANTAMTIMLIGVNIIFLVTTAPFALYNTDAFRPWIPAYSTKDNFLFSLSYIIQGINSASNFYIYCLSGQKFRDELKRTFSRRNSSHNDSIRYKSRRASSGPTIRSSNHTSNGHATHNNSSTKSNGSQQEGIVNEACDEDLTTRL